MTHVHVVRARSLGAMQREHELAEALKAGRKFRERLEMLGDRNAEADFVKTLLDSLAAEVGNHVNAIDYVREHEPSGDWFSDAVRADEIERTGR